MCTIRGIVALGAMAALLATAVLEIPETAVAGMPAPLPTQIPIRDINSPPSSTVTPAPFVPRAAPKRHRRTRPARRRPVAHQAPHATPAPAPTRAQNPALPKLEQRYEAPTDSLLPLGPEPAAAPAKSPVKGQAPSAAAFPPEPAPAPAPAPAPPATPPQAPPTAQPAPATTPAQGAAPAPTPAKP